MHGECDLAGREPSACRRDLISAGRRCLLWLGIGQPLAALERW